MLIVYKTYYCLSPSLTENILQLKTQSSFGRYNYKILCIIKTYS